MCQSMTVDRSNKPKQSISRCHQQVCGATGASNVFFELHLSNDDYFTWFRESKAIFVINERAYWVQMSNNVEYLCDSGFLPGSVGGLQAPTNCILSNETHCWSVVRWKPLCCTSWRKNEITRWVPVEKNKTVHIKKQESKNNSGQTLPNLTQPYLTLPNLKWWRGLQ